VTDSQPGLGLPTGTMVLTPRGPVPVEMLAPGMTILTVSDGAAPFQPVQEIRRVEHAGMMVRLQAGAIDDAMPFRDLLLPAGHALLIDNALVPAGDLVDGHGIVAEPSGEPVTLYLPILPRHEAILASGAAVETGLPSPEAASCAPRAEASGALRAILAWRAEQLGWAAPPQQQRPAMLPDRAAALPSRQKLMAEILAPARPPAPPVREAKPKLLLECAPVPTAQPRQILPAGEDFLLLAPAQQPIAYANVGSIFATRTIARGPQLRTLRRGAEIAPRYTIGDRSRSVNDFISRTQVAGLVVLQHGVIHLERYALGLTPATHWSTMSMVKSLTATLVGVALAEGRIGSLEETVSAHLPALQGSAYDAVSIRHLMTMSSGVRWSEDYTDRQSEVNRYSKSIGDKVPGGVLALMRSLPAEAAPGTRFAYCTGDTYVLGCLVSAVMDEGLAATMSRAVWGPAGMEADAFYTLESRNGQEIGGSRAGIVLRDLARFGQFILEDGMAGDRRILPAGWVAEASARHFALDPSTNSLGANGYGYSWWIAPDGAMVAVGFAGQSLYVNQATGTVIATLSCWPQPPYAAAYGIDFKAERQAFFAGVKAALG